MTREIELTHGLVALVDDADFEWLNAFNWHAHNSRATFYAKRWDGVRKIRMHRMILDAPNGVEVDHIDGNGLNNTRENLRLASKAQNLANRGKQANNSSGYKGVSYYARAGLWHAQIMVHQRRHHLGTFDTPEDAARAYDDAARAHFGDFAKTNF